MMNNYVYKILRRIGKGKNLHFRFSQSGEDLIIKFIFDILKIKKPTYIDIGAHHSSYLSNTYLFYLNGSKGICIEPNPVLCKELSRNRKNDICLNIGLGKEVNESTEFFIMSVPTLSTFSKTEAKSYQSSGKIGIEKTIKIPILNINDVLKKYLPNPNFISLDVEGLDFEIIESFDFQKTRPEVFVIETLTYTEDNSEEKIEKIIDYMKNKDYFLYADTYINSIFVDTHKWKNR